MAMKECCHCGREYTETFARRVTDDRYGPGRYDWICNMCGDLCASCATAELYLEDDEGNEVPPENIIYPGIND